jgi:hypothetical protein
MKGTFEGGCQQLQTVYGLALTYECIQLVKNYYGAWENAESHVEARSVVKHIWTMPKASEIEVINIRASLNKRVQW